MSIDLVGVITASPKPAEDEAESNAHQVSSDSPLVDGVLTVDEVLRKTRCSLLSAVRFLTAYSCGLQDVSVVSKLVNCQVVLQLGFPAPY